MPFQKEEELFPDDEDKCRELYESELENIKRVKSLLMPYLEVVEEGTERAEELLESNAGQDLDPTNEQHNDDCQEEREQDHPDFLFKDPSDFMEKSEVTNKETVYSKIELNK